MQYALMKMRDKKRIIDANELAAIKSYYKERMEKFDIEIVPPEKEGIITYGAVIPQYGQSLIEIEKEISKCNNFIYATLENNKCYVSEIMDIYYDNSINQIYGKMPVAVLLRTLLEINNNSIQSKTLSIYNENCNWLENIYNRKFIIAINSVEKRFRKNFSLNNWKNLIDTERLNRTAVRIK